MVELLAPGVYTLETSFRARSIQGVGTSTTGFVGLCRSGPTDGAPQLVTSFAEFERIFGGLEDLPVTGSGAAAPTNYLAHAVRGFFAEMGSRLYVARAFAPVDPASDDGHAGASLPAAGTPQVTFTARFPGAGGNGTLRLTEVVSPATDEALRKAPIGTFARSQGQAAIPARLAATAAPAIMPDGSELSISVDGGAAQTVTFTGTVASVGGTPLTFPISLGADRSITITADGLRQVIPLPDTINSMADIRLAINPVLERAVVRTGTGAVVVQSTIAGAGVTVTVDPIPELGFPGPDPVSDSGEGIDRLDRIRAADLNTLFSGAGITGVTAWTAPGGMLVIETTGGGAARSIDISATDPSVLSTLGFPPSATSDIGENAVARLVFVRTGAAAAGWQRYTDGGASGWAEDGPPVDPENLLNDTDYLVTLAVDFTNADGVAVSYDGMSLVAAHPRFLGNRMRPTQPGEEQPIGDPLVMTGTVNPAQLHALIFATPTISDGDVMSAEIALAGGNNGALPPLASWESALERLGLWDDIAIVAAPGSSAYPLVGQSVRRALATHAVNSRFRIAVLDPPPAQSMTALRQTRGEIDNSYAALYAPWIRVANPLARPGNEAIPRELLLPPSGHVCGIYARNDQLRGVHKTPANEVIRSAAGFETDYNQAQQGVLNPIGINCLRTIKGRGHRVYGGRLATSDREVVYVSDRRYLNFVKRSIFESMQWAVFEPNGPALWGNVREAVASFLYNQWFNGALFGVTQEEAYFVVCDGSVMTQADIDNGRMICEIGLALLKPAEFVVFRIGQKTADARR